MDQDTIIIVSLSAAAWALLVVVVLILTCQLSKLKKQVAELRDGPRLRVQKLTVEQENHAFHNPVISPDEELSRRGYSMYVTEDEESGRGTSERQTGGKFVEELTRELETRQSRSKQQPQPQPQPQKQPQPQPQSQPPPFLLNAIEDNKRRSRTLSNPVANYNNNNSKSGILNQGRSPSETNPNFIY